MDSRAMCNYLFFESYFENYLNYHATNVRYNKSKGGFLKFIFSSNKSYNSKH